MEIKYMKKKDGNASTRDMFSAMMRMMVKSRKEEIKCGYPRGRGVSVPMLPFASVQKGMPTITEYKRVIAVISKEQMDEQYEVMKKIKINPGKNCWGFVKRKSPRMCAQEHINYWGSSPSRPASFLSFDIKDFFHSIREEALVAQLERGGVNDVTIDRVLNVCMTRIDFSDHVATGKMGKTIFDAFSEMLSPKQRHSVYFDSPELATSKATEFISQLPVGSIFNECCRNDGQLFHTFGNQMVFPSPDSNIGGKSMLSILRGCIMPMLWFWSMIPEIRNIIANSDNTDLTFFLKRIIRQLNDYSATSKYYSKGNRIAARKFFLDKNLLTDRGREFFLKMTNVAQSNTNEFISYFCGFGRRKEDLYRILPQGAPSSPYLSNVAFGGLDARLAAFASSVGCHYSRYADDLTFSWVNRKSMKEMRLMEWAVKKIIGSEHLNLNEAKTMIQGPGMRQEILGYVVNSGKPTIRRDYRKSLEDDVKRFEDSNAGIMTLGSMSENLLGRIEYTRMSHPEYAGKLKERVMEKVGTMQDADGFFELKPRSMSLTEEDTGPAEGIDSDVITEMVDDGAEEVI